jgi:hypothetical protein
MDVKRSDKWLIQAIEKSLERVQKSELVNSEKLGAISSPKFIEKVQSALEVRSKDRAA